MAFLTPALTTASKPILFIPVLLYLVFIPSHGSVVEADYKTTKIGAILDISPRVGKEQKTAMSIAVHNFNTNSRNHKLSLHFRSPAGGDPLQAAYAAEELIKGKKVQVIVGMSTWAEAALVANIGNQAQVPVISFAAGAIRARQWPFLVQMVTDVSEQMDCTAAIVHSFNWKRVIVIYEEDMYGADSGMVALLSEALHDVGSGIEYHLVVPPFSSLLDREDFVHRELKKLSNTQPNRAFVVLRSSLPLTALLFSEAKKMGFRVKDSSWIVTDTTIASFLDSADASLITSMEGVLGIETDYSENTKSFQDFYEKFQQSFRMAYPEEGYSKPGIHALKAYDSISVIARALQKLIANGETSTWNSTNFLESILSSNFTGLSGGIHFEGGRLSYESVYKLVNVFNMTLNKLGYWSPNFGFSKSLNVEESGKNSSEDFMSLLNDSMEWLGNLKQDSKEWAMPTVEDSMIIGVPGGSFFENFVKITSTKNSNVKRYSGFCVSVFEEVLRLLDYHLPYIFVEFNGTYNELVHGVANKTFGAAVGDVTILSERWTSVEFTQPFTESGLSMVVPLKPSPKGLIFLKPFTPLMWLATGAILTYTMFTVWFLEHRSNPEFNGSWKEQLGNALWFTFSSLFFAHRERIQSNYTKVVVVVWLFVALILTQSYTASLTSMLTISRLRRPTIESLKSTNAKVGCGTHFMRTYAEDVLRYNPQNVMPISSVYDFERAFENGSISAAFLEISEAKIFINKHCTKYSAVGSTYRFGGLGFVFQKGSPIAGDVSKAILQLSEDGTLKRLEEQWLTPSSECSKSQTPENADRLSFHSFWCLYLFSIATSSVCFISQLLKNCRQNQESQVSDINERNENVWQKMLRLAKHKNKAETGSLKMDPTSAE